ncbi:MAG: glutamate--tRNA ligase [Candidatus Nealsonbacteria bacterium CG23_combo_of_CG06-09_8_20_14_all_40_13]|uniref:Glutamate--tRNA ligase n=1 Tax=Candidatus Nealsonbacteria bacterium CG23_combo_of_CG06-09_8_20_14_all_40_13 TaxID=1974724 RepID=A0A2G9YRE5_9BACT|nr:MAG: glutamate--tRNA ligase [Candidatus Nealsonbacteria bacterium CG23_combo_of_CG06-09_8_20_14_all_40_13]PIR70821.1 MAG: glutamate--tRNA ligase [Candidatus Nealsonbacteria bacterium CG10_big_fil_rev_8_21_14_0_10_40_24]PIU43371.1 MAG: glutamate--tRNA ligase [Candidatus Nealsonbacteria bacterium CG07_land_8_20_14_0_80_40_10]
MVRTRLAPSPTGKLHIGTARTALYNFLFARKNKGQFALRIEDTDQQRSSKKFELDITEGLTWLGIAWDEGPFVKGRYGPYYQSERLAIYQKYLDQLLKEGKAYRCFCTDLELAKEKEEQGKKGLPPKYAGRCRNLSAADIDQCKKEGKSSAVRFKVPQTEIVFQDLIRGEIRFQTGQFGDFVLQKSDGTFLFMFANAIDDFLMKISHVIRGEDHISNTPKQILILQALGMQPPAYAHVPLILNPDKTKMSKRQDPISISDDFEAKGYLPEALVNFLAFLGWNPGGEQEIYSLDELIADFSLEKVGKSPAVFNLEKLNWFNGVWLRKLTKEELLKRLAPFYEKARVDIANYDKEYLLNVVGLIRERIKKLDEAVALSDFFFTKQIKLQPEQLLVDKLDKKDLKNALEISLAEMEKFQVTDFQAEALEKTFRALSAKLNLSAGLLFSALRNALSGKKVTPPLFEMMQVLGKGVCVNRLQDALALLPI